LGSLEGRFGGKRVREKGPRQARRDTFRGEGGEGIAGRVILRVPVAKKGGPADRIKGGGHISLPSDLRGGKNEVQKKRTPEPAAMTE